MAATYEDIKALDFGYLTGLDLVSYCPNEIVIKQYNTDSDMFVVWINAAISTMKSLLSTSIDLGDEFEKTQTDRDGYILKLTTVCAVENITNKLTALPDNMKALIDWKNKECDELRKKQRSTPQVKAAPDEIRQTSSLISSSFNSLG